MAASIFEILEPLSRTFAALGTTVEDEIDLVRDLDSLDFLNFVVGIDNRTGLLAGESDYRQLTTLSGCVAYQSAHPTPA